MKRNIDINEISDGRKYGSNDMVKVGCSDCEGCRACCRGMGESILLDPFDIWQLTTNLNRSFESLLQKEVELHVVDGLILPNLALNGEKESCHFLNQHQYRNLVLHSYHLSVDSGKYSAEYRRHRI